MSAAVEALFEDEDSDFSREGTFAHELGEARLALWLRSPGSEDERNARVALGAVESSPAAAEFYSDEMSAYVDVYTSFVADAITSAREAHGPENVVVLLEQRLDFSEWVPVGFGTGDVVIVYPGGVWVIDLKYGAGVRVTDTGQLRLYGLGALARYDMLYDIESVTVSIVQPRMDNISTEVVSKSDLLHWADELVVPRAKIAWAAFNGDRTQARFSPGEHCATGFCKARYTCAARARYMLEATEQPYVKDAPDVLTDEQLEAVVDRARLAVKWLSDCERYLTDRAATGKAQLKHHEIRPGRSIRVIEDPGLAARVLMENGYAANQVYKEPALRGLVELENLVGAKQLVELLGDNLTKPAGKPTLFPKQEPKPVKKGNTAAAQADFGDLGDE